MLAVVNFPQGFLLPKGMVDSGNRQMLKVITIMLTLTLFPLASFCYLTNYALLP